MRGEQRSEPEPRERSGGHQRLRRDHARGRRSARSTERDIVTAFVNGLDPNRTLVATCMTSGPMVATPDEQVSEAALRMVNGGIRHLPVVEDGHLVGMLSARDLITLDL